MPAKDELRALVEPARGSTVVYQPLTNVSRPRPSPGVDWHRRTGEGVRALQQPPAWSYPTHKPDQERGLTIARALSVPAWARWWPGAGPRTVLGLPVRNYVR